MPQFEYYWKGRKVQSFVEHYLEDNAQRFRVSLPDGTRQVILPAGIPGPGGMIIWLQYKMINEPVLDYALVQSIGEGIEKVFSIPKKSRFRNMKFQFHNN